MMARLIVLIRRVPWRLLATVLAGALIVNGGSRILSVEMLPQSGDVIGAVRQGMGTLVVGGAVLIAVIMTR
jgi:hypothetical protein